MMSTNPLLGVGKWLPKACNSTYRFVCNRDLGEFMSLQIPEVKYCIYETNSMTSSWFPTEKHRVALWRAVHASYLYPLQTQASQTNLMQLSLLFTSLWATTVLRSWPKISPGRMPRRTVRVPRPTWRRYGTNGRRPTLSWWLWISKPLFGSDSTNNWYETEAQFKQ